MAVVWAAALGMCLPAPALTYAADTLPAPEGAVPAVTDVALADGGVLVGQVSDSSGVAQAAVRVSFQTPQGQELFAMVTDQQGAFRAQGVRPGVYQIVTPQARGFYRLWAPGTAPASAKPAALVVGNTVRGALGDTIVAHPFITAAVVAGVATAIAVPLALTNKHKSS
jgi:hypothetical protein